MRKRSKRRVRPQMQVHWVLDGLQPASTASSIRTQQIRNHNAIAAVLQGETKFEDADNLLAAFNVAEALATLRLGVDYLPEITQAQDALRSAGLRQKFTFTGPELEIVNTAMLVHDLQLASPLCTVELMEQALVLVRKNIKLRRSKPITFKQGEMA